MLEGLLLCVRYALCQRTKLRFSSEKKRYHSHEFRFISRRLLTIMQIFDLLRGFHLKAFRRFL